MNSKTYRYGMRLFRIVLAAMLAITFVVVAGAQQKENIGRVQQGLVGGSVVSFENREQIWPAEPEHREQWLQRFAAEEQLGDHGRSLR